MIGRIITIRQCLNTWLTDFIGIMAKSLEPFRERAILEIAGSLWTQVMPPAERISKNVEASSTAEKSIYFGEKWNSVDSDKSFCEGMRNYSSFPEIQEIPQVLNEPALAYDIYAHFADSEKDDSDICKARTRFRHVLESVGGEKNYDLAKYFYEYMEEEAKKSRDREKCLIHCIEAHSLRQDPRKTPWNYENAISAASEQIEISDDSVTIGGIRFEVNRS